jgi:hypothetical protein
VFLLHKGGHPILIARQGQNAPGGGFFEGSTQGHTALNNSGELGFVFGLKPFSQPALGGFVHAGLYRYLPAGGRLEALVIPGITVAPRFGAFRSTGQHASINSGGDVVFPGVVPTASGDTSAGGIGQGIFLTDRRGRIRVVAAPGDPAPGGGVFDFAGNPWINDRGDVAFGAHVAGEECIPAAPACMESTYRKDAATGRIESIAHQGGQAPGGHFYRAAWGPALNNRGDIVFMGELTPPPGMPSARGVFLYAKGATMAIARPGDIMPGGRELLTVNPVSSAGNYSLNDRGDVTFNATLRGGASGLYLYSRGTLHRIAETGTVIPGLGSVAAVSGLVGGVLNEATQVFFWAVMTDGRGVLLLASPSTRLGD